MKKSKLTPEQQRLLAGYAKEASDTEGGLVKRWTNTGDREPRKPKRGRPVQTDFFDDYDDIPF